MSTLTQLDAFAIGIAIGVAIYVAWDAIEWCAERVIDGIREICRFEHD